MQTSRDRLAATLEILREKAASPNAEGISEAGTRSVFVDALLQGMGFEGLSDIEWEYFVKASNERIDYVLKIDGRPTVAVEAKSLGTELIDKHAAQLVQYAVIEGIEWCLLTNGRKMRIYNASLTGNLGAKHVADLDLFAEAQSETLDVLFLLSKEGLSRPENLNNWMRTALLDRTLRLLLLDSESSTVQQLASAASSATSFDVTTEQVSRWFARILAAAPTPTPPTSVPPPVRSEIETAVSYWLLPARPADDGAPPVEELHRWLDAGMWGLGRSTAGRKKMKEGDRVCFYGTGVGVVAWARLTEPCDELVTAEEWPEPTPMEREVFKVPLKDVQWLPEPIAVDERLRSKLDAFRGKSSSIWSWFVQSTSKLSQRDFNLLVGQA